MKYLLAMLFGSVLGTTFFYTLDTVIPIATVSPEVYFMQYSGVVSMYDTEKKTIRITMPSVFSVSAPSRDMQFSYDEDTTWGSFEYVFENDIVTRRRAAEAQPIQLPVGTLVTIQRDPYENIPFRASVIVFLKRIVS